MSIEENLKDFLCSKTNSMIAGFTDKAGESKGIIVVITDSTFAAKSFAAH